MCARSARPPGEPPQPSQPNSSHTIGCGNLQSIIIYEQPSFLTMKFVVIVTSSDKAKRVTDHVFTYNR